MNPSTLSIYSDLLLTLILLIIIFRNFSLWRLVKSQGERIAALESKPLDIETRLATVEKKTEDLGVPV